jgi:hypothetical protein
LSAAGGLFIDGKHCSQAKYRRGEAEDIQGTHAHALGPATIRVLVVSMQAENIKRCSCSNGTNVDSEKQKDRAAGDKQVRAAKAKVPSRIRLKKMEDGKQPAAKAASSRTAQIAPTNARQTAR